MYSYLSRFEAIEPRIALKFYTRLNSTIHAQRSQKCPGQSHRRRYAIPTAELPLKERNPTFDACETLRHPSTLESQRGQFLGDHDETTQAHLPEFLPTRRELREGMKLGDTHPASWYFGDQTMRSDLDVVAKEVDDFRIALRIGNPHMILASLLAISKPHGFPIAVSMLSAVPATVFSEVLRSLDPGQFVDRYRRLHAEMGPRAVSKLGLIDASIDQHHTFLSSFMNSSWQILQNRKRYHKLGLSDYKYLLRCAQVSGSIQEVETIWWSLQMASQQAREQRQHASEVLVEADAECYNLYLGLKCWNELWNPHLRNRLRIIPRNMIPRFWDMPPAKLSGHRLGPRQGLKQEASMLFREMVDAGVAGNAETFCLMMVALGREGDLAGVESILKQVWKLDVNSLVNEDLVPTFTDLACSPDSPFYPTKTLLFTLAHVYGTNNTIPTALRLVDHVSRHYSVEIPREVWSELLQWTFVLSHSRKGLSAADKSLEIQKGANDIGKLPPKAVYNLWQTMVSEPYNIRPTMQMYNWLIVSLHRRRCWGEMQKYMDEAQWVAKRDIRRRNKARELFLASQRVGAPNHIIQLRQRDLAYASLRVSINRAYVQKWFRLLTKWGSIDRKFDLRWAGRNMPDIVAKYQHVWPMKLTYVVRTGEVTLILKKPLSKVTKRRKRWEEEQAQIMREEAMRHDDGHKRMRGFEGKVFKMKSRLSRTKNPIFQVASNYGKHM